MSSIRVTLGNIYRDKDLSSTQKRGVKNMLVHQNWSLDENKIQSFNDIGMLLLDEPIKKTFQVSPIKLGTVNPDRQAIIYGFGSINPNRQGSNADLRKKVVNVIDEITCHEIHKTTEYRTNMQCYEFCTTVGICWGDSGGGVIQWLENEPKLVGIISWGADDIISCNTAPNMHLKPAQFLDWIENGVQELRKEM